MALYGQLSRSPQVAGRAGIQSQGRRDRSAIHLLRAHGNRKVAGPVYRYEFGSHWFVDGQAGDEMGQDCTIHVPEMFHTRIIAEVVFDDLFAHRSTSLMLVCLIDIQRRPER